MYCLNAFDVSGFFIGLFIFRCLALILWSFNKVFWFPSLLLGIFTSIKILSVTFFLRAPDNADTMAYPLGVRINRVPLCTLRLPHCYLLPLGYHLLKEMAFHSCVWLCSPCSPKRNIRGYEFNKFWNYNDNYFSWQIYVEITRGTLCWSSSSFSLSSAVQMCWIFPMNWKVFLKRQPVSSQLLLIVLEFEKYIVFWLQNHG